MKEKGSHNPPNLKLYKSLLKKLQENAGDKEIELRVRRYVRMLTDAYSQVTTNKLKSRFRYAVQNNDLISLCSLSLALERKQVLSFAPYQEGVLTAENLEWLNLIGSFIKQSMKLSPGTEKWCQKINPLLDMHSPCLGSSLQLIDELQWHYYLSLWPAYKQAIEYDKYNLHIHDPRLCLLARWAYDAPVYLD